MYEKVPILHMERRVGPGLNRCHVTCCRTADCTRMLLLQNSCTTAQLCDVSCCPDSRLVSSFYLSSPFLSPLSENIIFVCSIAHEHVTCLTSRKAMTTGLGKRVCLESMLAVSPSTYLQGNLSMVLRTFNTRNLTSSSCPALVFLHLPGSWSLDS